MNRSRSGPSFSKKVRVRFRRETASESSDNPVKFGNPWIGCGFDLQASLSTATNECEPDPRFGTQNIEKRSTMFWDEVWEVYSNFPKYHSVAGSVSAFVTAVLITVLFTSMFVDGWTHKSESGGGKFDVPDQDKKRRRVTLLIAVPVAFVVCPIVVYVFFELGLLNRQ